MTNLMESLPSFVVVVVILFVPGFTWSFVFYSVRLGRLQRAARSVGLSVILMAMIGFWVERVIGIQLNLWTLGLLAASLTMVPVILINLPRLKMLPLISRIMNLAHRNSTK